MDPLVEIVAAKFAAIKRLDLAWVEGLRKDFLTLLKNLPRVKDYKTAHQLREGLKGYRKNFDELFFEHFLNKDLKYNYENFGLSEGEAKWIDKQLRSIAWAFSAELSTMPIGFKDDYYSEEARFATFEREAPAWKARLQRKAQVFWKEMKSTIEWLENVRKKQFNVKVPTSENATLEGFKLLMKGYEPDDPYHPEELEILKEGLKRYRQRASAVAPILLQKQCPIEIEFKSTLDKGGEYGNGVVTFYMSSVANRGPDWVVHALAHEMGHHLFKTFLSQGARDFWYQTIRGDYGDLDIKELLDKWPGDTWAYAFPEVMGKEDPVLALQVDAISHDQGYGQLQKKEDFEKLYNEGTRTLRVPKTPITGYANKNPEEAFCETLGLLVAYGPQAVHEKVRWWLDTVIPGAVKVARLEARIVERFKAAKAKPLHTFKSKDGDLESYVWEATKGGFNVTLKDLDSDNFLPTAVHTNDLTKAVETAKKWVK